MNECDNKKKIYTISVVIPVYNDALYLEESIESVYAQTDNEIEVIAVDDGSTDNSLTVLKTIQNEHPSLIVITQENGGPGAARNRGLQEATGEFIYFLDGDDIIEPDLVRLCSCTIIKEACDVVGFEADIFGNVEGRDPRQYWYDYRCKDMENKIGGIQFFANNHKKIPMLNVPLLFWKRRFLLENNLMFMENVLYEDMDFYYRMIAANPQIFMMHVILYHRRYRYNSIMTSSINQKNIYDRIKVYMKIAKIDTSALKKLYCRDVLKEIRKSIAELYTLRLNFVPEQRKQLVILLKEMEGFNLDFLGMCQLYLCYQDLTEECVILKKNIKNKIEFLNDKLWLYKKGCKVGIYGTGLISDIFIKVYIDIMGEFGADIIYIDTYAKTGERLYQNIPITNYKEVDFKSMSAVIVASEIYDDDICKTIRNIDRDIQIYDLTEDGYFT